MRLASRALATGLIILGLLTLTGGVALAQGGGGNNSAGNSQYVDPLAANGHSKGGSHGSGSQGASGPITSANTTTTTGSSTLSPSAPTSVTGNASSSSSSTSTQASSKTLPFTGLNLWACVGLGVGLLAAGLALRRALARTY